MESLLISACLLGVNCKYSGGNNVLPPETREALAARYRLVPVCPERDGGLPTPRAPSERRGDRVLNREGEDVTDAFARGAALALAAAEQNGCGLALMKERSPSCGSGAIYDGSFGGVLVSGDGVAAALLKEKGLAVFGETECYRLL
jgi:uncharacterized protein YbbK (DUF523 family)